MIFIILIAFFSLIFLIILHELGHFLLAKKFGVKVEEFGIGLPPRLIGKKFGETLFSLNLLPFGAFVKIYGEEKHIKDHRSFSEKPFWQRASIILGGVVSFWIIAAILLSIVMSLGTIIAVSDEDNGDLINPRIQITAVAIDSPAEIAGIRPGDSVKEFKIIESVFKIQKVGEFQELIEEYKGQEIILTIERGREVFETSLTPRVFPPEGQGPIGISLARTAEKSYPWYEAPLRGIESTFYLTRAIIAGLVDVFKNLVLGRGLPPGVQLMGPVGIVTIMTQFVRLGLNYYLNFIAMLSIYLALFNLLPIPALDGGKLLFLIIEAVRKRPVEQKVEQKITTAFFILLISIIIWVTIKDIKQLF